MVEKVPQAQTEGELRLNGEALDLSPKDVDAFKVTRNWLMSLFGATASISVAMWTILYKITQLS